MSQTSQTGLIAGLLLMPDAWAQGQVLEYYHL